MRSSRSLILVLVALLSGSGCSGDPERSRLADESTSKDNKPRTSNSGSSSDSGGVSAAARDAGDAGAGDAGADSDDAGRTAVSDAGDASVIVVVEAGPAGEPEPLRFADGAVIKFEEPEPEPEPPQPGDELTNLSGDGGTNSGVPFEEDPFGVNAPSVCLHVKLADATFFLVGGTESPSDRYESILRFSETDEGFRLYAGFPWELSFPGFDASPAEFPLGEQIRVVATRLGAEISVSFEVEDDLVVVHSVVVEEYEY